jgi:phosphate starvation-inducible protein PhoH
MANDLFSALRTYLMKLGNGEKTPQELAAALNVWARESGEAIKLKIEEEVKRNVSRMGFAKASDLKRLEREVMELKSLIKGKAKGAPKKSNSSKSNSSKSANRNKKNSSTKKKSK